MRQRQKSKTELAEICTLNCEFCRQSYERKKGKNALLRDGLARVVVKTTTLQVINENSSKRYRGHSFKHEHEKKIGQISFGL